MSELSPGKYYSIYRSIPFYLRKSFYVFYIEVTTVELFGPINEKHSSSLFMMKLQLIYTEIKI